jgi:hypothetical protein
MIHFRWFFQFVSNLLMSRSPIRQNLRIKLEKGALTSAEKLAEPVCISKESDENDPATESLGKCEPHL